MTVLEFSREIVPIIYTWRDLLQGIGSGSYRDWKSRSGFYELGDQGKPVV